MLLTVFLKKYRIALSVWVILAISVLAAGQAYAQVSGATLSGTVKDSSGGAVAKAEVAITDTSTAVTRNTVTDDSGIYTAPNLLPGTYQVTVTAPGFSTAERTGVTLTVGAQQELDFAMQVGQVTQTVQVTEEAPTVELASSSLDAEVNSTTVRELPLNGRSWTDLGSLQAGVNQPNTQVPLTSAGRGQRGFGTQVSITGTRPDENLYRLDGININDYANNAPGGVSGGASGVDAIQEFTVLTGNAPAQYGRSSGGVFNAITRSGTNQIHGSGYEFLRNSAMDARNTFDPLTGPPAFRRNQFGASLGGPIHKDTTFIFGNYEGLRQSLGITQTGVTLSNSARIGNLSTGTVPVDPNVAAYIAAFAAPANGAALTADTNKFTTTVTNPSTANFFTTRFDQKFSDKDSMDAVYSFDESQILVPNVPNIIVALFSTRRHSAALEETHIFSSQTINSFRLGYNRSIASVGSTPTAVVPGAAGATFAAIPGPGIGAVGLSLPGGINTFSGGLNSPPFYFFHFNSIQAYDDAFLTKGIHGLKLGFSFERIGDNDGARQGTDGTFSFNTLSDFMQNKPFRFAGALATTASGERGIRESIFGAYIQDDIRARSNLTLNVGLRYETATVPTEVHNELTNMVPFTAAMPRTGSPYFQNFTDLDFEPRLGFSWDPLKNGKTAVRGGFGVFDMLPMPYEFYLGNATTAPFYLQGSITSVCPGPNCLNGTFQFPSPAYALLQNGSSTGGFKYSYVEPSPKRRYIMEWNLNAQRELTPSLTLMVGYVASRGLHLPYHQDDMNFNVPYPVDGRYVFAYPLNPNPQIASLAHKLNTNIGTLVGEEMLNHSWYDALQVEVTKKLSRGFQLHGAYTWGRNLDYDSGTFAGDSFGNGKTTQPWFNPQLWKGLADFSLNQNLIINGIWDLPSPNGGAGVEGHVLGGWELGGIFKANSGAPLTMRFGSSGDAAGMLGTDVSMLTPDRLGGPGCSTLINPRNPNAYIKAQCFSVPTAPSAAFYTANCDPSKGVFPQCFNLFGDTGRNTVIGPGLMNLDFSLYKNNYVRRISENFNIQLRWEVFNILNRANYAEPPTTLFDSTGKSIASSDFITNTQTPSRQMQIALKVMW